MTDRQTVWLVEDTSYEDQRVLGICSSKEKAETLASMYPGADDPEEWEMDGDIPALKKYSVEATMQSVEEARQISPDREEGARFFLRTRTFILEVITVADSEEHACKIANERRRQFVAEGTWGVNEEGRS